MQSPCEGDAIVSNHEAGARAPGNARATVSPRNRLIAWVLCLIGGIAVGVSRFNSVSNHPTYLPPGLRYLDPTYLAGDWWLNVMPHYHYAYFALTAALDRLGILEVGLALLNVVTVAGALYAGYRIVVLLRAAHPLACLALLVATFLVTATFFSVGTTFLFMQSLQPSSVAAATTLAAILAFLEERPLRCGLWLGLGGLFHVNYLVLNVPLFGMAFALKAVIEGNPRHLLSRRSMIELVQMFAPSLLLIAINLPVLLSIQRDVLSPAAGAEADWIFFHFAVPFHYYPLDWLGKLPVLFGWQALGLLWTIRAVPDPAQRQAVWALQLAFILVLWTAIALTTLVFVAPVARLLLWRLAPFAEFLAALLIIVGAVRLLSSGGEKQGLASRDSRVLLWTIAVLAVLTPFIPGADDPQFTGIYPPGPMVLGLLFVFVAVRLWTTVALPWNKTIAAPVLLGLIGLCAAALPVNDERSRYSLVLSSQTPEARDEDAVFAFVRRSTPADAQFLIPPTLDMFRLQGQRAVVVDFKAMPVDRPTLIEWYRRLAAISGLAHPANMAAVYRGYQTLDPSRLEALRRRYRLSHVVLLKSQPMTPDGWHEIYRNSGFRVLTYRGH